MIVIIKIKGLVNSMKRYRRVLISIGILLIGVSFLFFSRGDHEIDQFEEKIKSLGITSYAIGNVMGDGEEYLVGLIGEDLVIHTLAGVTTEVYRKDYSHLKPWKVALGDVDGNGVDEISIGVYKESPLHPVMAKRPFIYSFINSEMQPKWRGSRLSRPFIDYNFYDIDGDGIDELVSIEILKDGRNLMNIYKWKGFGFEGFVESEDFEQIYDLSVSKDGIFIKIKEGKKNYSETIVLENNKLIIERVK